MASAKNNIYEEVRNSRDFTGKVVLVTGSCGGIGSQTVKLFSALGANVVVTGRKADIVHKVGKEVQTLSPKGLKPLEVIADLTKFDELQRLVNETIKEFGKIDVLVNNAGIFLFFPITSEDFMEGFDNQINIDVRPALQLIRLTLPYLKKSKGVIINLSSVFSSIPQRYLLAYNCCKASLITATQELCQELGPMGIRINTVSPCFCLSKPLEEEPKEIQDIYPTVVKTTPLGRYGQPIDIAKAIVFLASSDAQFITGANIDVDGGLRYNIGGGFTVNH